LVTKNLKLFILHRTTIQSCLEKHFHAW